MIPSVIPPERQADPTFSESVYQPPEGVIPRRVVSLVPSLTESLFDLGLGKRLIAVTDYCTRPEAGVAALPKIGGTKRPRIDQITAMQPDLVLMNDEENRAQDAQALLDAGIPIWVFRPRTVKAAIDDLWAIMTYFEEARMTERVRLIDVSYEGTLKYNAGYAPIKVFVPIWRDPWMSVNADTYVHDLLKTCGAINVFADLTDRYPVVTLDQVVAAQPDLILLPDEPYQFGEVDAAELKGLFGGLDVPAVKRDQVKLIDGSLLTWHGTRTAYALQLLPPLIASAR